jgi:S1-C subfamily serine protease
MTQGIVSALDREITSLGNRPITGVIQTDAPINPGNSGGPLLDKDGRLIGVNTQIALAPGGGQGNVGIGFAIPVDTVNDVVTQIIQSGKAVKPGLGVLLLPDSQARQLGVSRGAMLRAVQPNSAAEQAGLRGLQVNARGQVTDLGDVIVAVNGQAVATMLDVPRLLSRYKVGDRVKLTVLRGDKETEVDVGLQGL